jgi:hypothetical protein
LMGALNPGSCSNKSTSYIAPSSDSPSNSSPES